jgi:hypothetical protein
MPFEYLLTCARELSLSLAYSFLNFLAHDEFPITDLYMYLRIKGGKVANFGAGLIRF